MTRYEIILYWSSEDDAFIAEVPARRIRSRHHHVRWEDRNIEAIVSTRGGTSTIHPSSHEHVPAADPPD